ncbi:MAG: acetyl-CoA carboxylase carboxyltransferase subunit alpha [Lentisphaerae bacterium]|nr:acetyl-CoA carboxylase carboxyltransferase subunit alpha [Lentisphaerota bacterium]
MELDFEAPLGDMDARIAELERLNRKPDADFNSEIAALKRERDVRLSEIYETLTPWQTVQLARHPERPVFADYVERLCDEFLELHGDRCFGDDRALIGGFARFGGERIMLIGFEKGKTMDDKLKANFGMAGPDGYRKALRLMRLAEKYGLPVVSLIDTPAAYPGRDAEARGQAEAIARNLTAMAVLETPFVAVVTGEGGSGGALGAAVGDAVLMLSNAVYSVIPPEGCAAILWRDASKAPQAAESLKLTAPSLRDLGVIDEIIPEPPGGAHRFPEAAMDAVRDAVQRHLKRLRRMNVRRLVDKRFEKYAAIGKYDNRKYAQH